MKDFEITLYVPKHADVSSLEILDNFHIVRGPTQFLVRLFIVLPIMTFSRKPDVVWGQNFLPMLCRPATRKLVTVHDFLPLTHMAFFSTVFCKIFSFLVSSACRNADKVIVSTQYSMQVLKDLFPAYANKARVIPIPIEFDEPPSRKQRKRTTPYCIYVSRFERRKNHRKLIEAWSLGNNDDRKLVLVGFDVDGSKKEIVRFVEENALQNIDFRERLVRQELVDLIAGAEFAIYPSLAEGFGMPIFEAYVFNGKIAFSHESAMKDFSDINACRFDPNSTDEITKAIDKMFDTPNIKGTSAWSRKLTHLKNLLGVPAISQQYKEVFHELS